MSGLAALVPRYDGFIIDLWGVVHDGIAAYPGVVACLGALRAAGKRVVFLSNAPRRAAAIGETLALMGIGPALYDGIMSSGEAVHLALRDREEPDIAPLGTRLFHLGPARDRGVFETLDLSEAATPEDADFLLNTGPDDHLGPDDPKVYEPTLRAALAAGLPMLCANPDLEVIRNGKRIICAGLLAQIYAAWGGAVIMRGKPDPAIYWPTLVLLGTAASHTLAVGDSLRTDIVGAQAAGIDSCWVLSGVDAPNPEQASVVATSFGLSPVAIMPGLSW